jgi:hypothetical protein
VPPPRLASQNCRFAGTGSQAGGLGESLDTTRPLACARLPASTDCAPTTAVWDGGPHSPIMAPTDGRRGARPGHDRAAGRMWGGCGVRGGRGTSTFVGVVELAAPPVALRGEPMLLGIGSGRRVFLRVLLRLRLRAAAAGGVIGEAAADGTAAGFGENASICAAGFRIWLRRSSSRVTKWRRCLEPHQLDDKGSERRTRRRWAGRIRTC